MAGFSFLRPGTSRRAVQSDCAPWIFRGVYFIAVEDGAPAAMRSTVTMPPLPE